MPGLFRSEQYLARPEAFSTPSRRLMRLPITRRLDISGQRYSGIGPSFHRLGRFEHGLADSHIGAAAAKVAAEAVLDLLVGRIGIAVEKRLRRDDEARRAVAALLGVVVDEGLHQRMRTAAA